MFQSNQKFQFPNTVSVKKPYTIGKKQTYQTIVPPTYKLFLTISTNNFFISKIFDIVYWILSMRDEISKINDCIAGANFVF